MGDQPFDSREDQDEAFGKEVKKVLIQDLYKVR